LPAVDVVVIKGETVSLSGLLCLHVNRTD